MTARKNTMHCDCGDVLYSRWECWLCHAVRVCLVPARSDVGRRSAEPLLLLEMSHGPAHPKELAERTGLCWRQIMRQLARLGAEGVVESFWNESCANNKRNDEVYWRLTRGTTRKLTRLHSLRARFPNGSDPIQARV